MSKFMLVPQYMRKFSCICGECECNCCDYPWSIYIDKKTYKKCMNIKDASYRTEFRKSFIKEKNIDNNYKYALLKKTEENLCPFKKDGLCMIHKKFGEEYLSVTCSVYPRSTSIVNGVLEMSASLSCPEVARLALLNPNPMEFDEIEKHDNYIISKQPNTNKPAKYFWDLRVFIITVLQNRKLSIEYRLLLLGLFFNKFKDNDERTMEQIPSLINSYEKMMNSQDMVRELEGMIVFEEFQLELLRFINSIREHARIDTKEFKECIEEVEKGILGLTQKTLSEEEVNNYSLIYKEYYQPFMKEHEYILENYLVNYVFSNIFPYETDKSIYNEYCYMVLHFSLIRTYLIGISGYNKGLNLDMVIKLIYSFTREFDHGRPILPYVLEKLQEINKFNLEHISMLIKN